MRRFFRDGRLVALIFVAGYFLLLALVVVISHSSLTDTWKAFGVPALNPHFGDLWNIVAGIESRDAGGAVGDPNPFDPWQRPYIYPSLWLHVSAIGFNRATVVGFGWAIILLYFVSAYLVLGKLSTKQGVFAGLFLISPALMTGVERCNIDLILFPLILAALALRRWPAASGAMLLLATVLKIQPIGTLIALSGPPWKKTLPWLGIVLVCLFIYVVSYRNELAVISAHSQHYFPFTFGSTVWVLRRAPEPWPNWPHHYSVAFFWGSLLMLGVAGTAAWFAPYFPPRKGWEREIYAFRLGAGFFLALFALGANNDYGMMFLLFCLPLLFRVRVEGGALKAWAFAALACTLLYVNWDLFSNEEALPDHLFKQVVAWGLMASVAGILKATCLWPSTYVPAEIHSKNGLIDRQSP